MTTQQKSLHILLYATLTGKIHFIFGQQQLFHMFANKINFQNEGWKYFRKTAMNKRTNWQLKSRKIFNYPSHESIRKLKKFERNDSLLTRLDSCVLFFAFKPSLVELEVIYIFLLMICSLLLVLLQHVTRSGF